MSETAPVAQFFPFSLSIPQSEQPSRDDCRLLLERPDGARLSISLPNLNEALISALCSDFLNSR